MKSRVGGKLKSKLQVAVLLVVAAVVLFRVVRALTDLSQEAERELFVIEVSNQGDSTVDDVKISGLGNEGNLGPLPSDELKRIVVEEGVLTEDLSLTWAEPSGERAAFERPEKWETGTRVQGLVFKVTFNEDGSVSCHDEQLTMLYQMKYGR